MLSHLKMVAKIGLITGVIACIVLLAILLLITDSAGDSYGHIIQSHALTRQHLGLAMLVGGMVLVSFSGLLTWVIALYSSFRVAGPLYRFSQNFMQVTLNDSAELIGIRKEDYLQEQADAIKKAVLVLHEQHRTMKNAAQEASTALEAGDAERYTVAVMRLRGLDEKYRI